MRGFRHIITTTFILLHAVFFDSLSAQNNTVVILKDTKIDQLLKLKGEINKDDSTAKNYKIQIYSGSSTGAKEKLNAFKAEFTQWTSKIVFETPNHKVWIGNFRKRLEADRALIKITEKFDRAFIFKPKKRIKKIKK